LPYPANLMRALRTATLGLLLLGNAAAFAGPGDIVYGTNTGHKYHRAGCQYLRKSKVQMTLGQAKAKGLTPCNKCHPLQALNEVICFSLSRRIA
jgi:hypothetical protein